MGDKEDAGVDELAARAATLQLSSATTSSPTPQSRPRRSPGGPISYDDLKTVEGETHATFKGAALAMGLLDSDEDNHRCLAQFQMPTQLRHLFAVLLVYCDPASPDDLWNAHLPAPCEDFLRDEIEIHNLQARAENRISEVIMDAASLDTNSRVYRRAIYLTLHDVKSHLVSNGQTLHTYFESLPQFSDYSDVETAVDVDDRNRNRLIENETSYESTTLDHQAAALNSLNADQKRVYDKVMEAVHPAGPDASVLVLSGKQFFLDGPGGTGKSFLLETILASIRREGRIALAVAGSGIAAQLLTGGRTAHSTFRLLLDPDETSTCNFGVRSSEAALLKQTSLINATGFAEKRSAISWNRDAAVRRLPPTLPVIPRAGPAEVISASLKRSPLWRDFEFLRLSINMRVQTAQDQDTAQAVQGVADYLLRVGDGRHETCTELGSDYVKIASDMLLDVSGMEISVVNEVAEQGTAPKRLSRLIEKVYSGFDDGNQPDRYFTDRIILTPKNADVLAINDMILDMLPGDAKEYRSVDCLDGDDELERQAHGDPYPPEFLNTISLSGMPPHKLKLKVGALVMLIRNLNTKEGLCNRTRLRVVQLRRNCMKAAMMSGAFAGKEAIIPRVTLISKNSGFPFELRRKQFPVQVAFAMTINKSQGQSIQHLGLFSQNQCFPTGSFMWRCPGLPPEGMSRF